MDITSKINTIAIEYFQGNNSLFASKMGTSEANIRNYRTKIVPKLDFVIKLSKTLEINYDWLLEDIGDMKRSADKDHRSRAKKDDQGASIALEEVNSIYKDMIALQKKVIELQDELKAQNKSPKTSTNDPVRSVERQLK